MPLDSEVIGKLCNVAIAAREARNMGDDWRAPQPEDFRAEIQVLVSPFVKSGEIGNDKVDTIYAAVMDYALGKSSALEPVLAEIS